MAVLKPKRGSVWWVNFDPTKGTEVKKARPAIVVSNNVSNKYLDRFQVVPLTSNITNIYPSECLVLVKDQQGKAMVDQIRTVSSARFGKKISDLSKQDVDKLGEVIKLQLDL